MGAEVQSKIHQSNLQTFEKSDCVYYLHSEPNTRNGYSTFSFKKLGSSTHSLEVEKALTETLKNFEESPKY